MSLSVVLLAAGLGTRLRPLSSWRAKPLVPIGDRPAIGHVLASIRGAWPGVPVVANAHFRPEDVIAWAAANDVRVSEERELLGTAGGVARAQRQLDAGDLLIWNGDILSDVDVRALATAHSGSQAMATLVVTPRPANEGNVGIDAAGRVVRLRRQSFGPETRGGDFHGVQLLGAEARASLPPSGCLVTDVYLPLLAEGAHLAVHDSGSFSDVGTIEDYVAENRAWLVRRGAASWAAPSARVEADVDGCIVGERSIVRAPARRVIVWPDAIVDTPIADAIVTPHGTVRLSES